MSSAPSRSDPTGLERLTALILDRLPALEGAAPVVLIDGRSGAGKTTLARMLRERVPDATDLLSLDSIYPGWSGLAAASDMLADDILGPLARGEDGSWRRWDWEAGMPAEEHRVPAGAPLIVEGAGALTPRTAPLASVSVWMDAPAAERRRRALDRDGAGYEPYWDLWAAQEDEHIRRHRPVELADLRYIEPSTARTSPSSR